MNRTIIWFSTSGKVSHKNGNDVEIYETVNVKATIKEFKEYNGIKHTSVNRVTCLN